MEHHWYRRWFEDSGEPWLYSSADDPDDERDLHPRPGDSLDEAITMWHRQVAYARALTTMAGLDDRSARIGEPARPDFQPSMRWILVHLIEEYARHCGHADLIRERIDGSTGD